MKNSNNRLIDCGRYLGRDTDGTPIFVIYWGSDL
jgi:hypothetical protein